MIKKGDFVQLDYTGLLTETQKAFDTTLEKVAQEKNWLPTNSNCKTVKKSAASSFKKYVLSSQSNKS